MALGVSGREDSVDEDERANDLGAESSSLGVARSNQVSSTAERVVVVLHESLDEPNTGDCTETLSHHVSHRSNQRNLSRQEQSERHGRVNVATF